MSGSLLLAPFQKLLQDANAVAPKSQTLFEWLLKEDRPAEGIPLIEDLKAWAIAKGLHRMGFLAEREWPCTPSPDRQ